MSTASQPEPRLDTDDPVILTLREPGPETGRGAELRLGETIVGGLIAVPTALGAPAVDHLLRHLTSVLPWAEIAAAFPGPYLEALRAHRDGDASAFALELRPRASLAEWAGAAVAAINPVVGRRAVDADRPLGSLYALALVEDIDSAEAEPRPSPELRWANDGRCYVDPGPIWRTLLRDISEDARPSRSAARFLVAVVDGLGALAVEAGARTIALEGPAFEHPDFRFRMLERLSAQHLELA